MSDFIDSRYQELLSDRASRRLRSSYVLAQNAGEHTIKPLEVRPTLRAKVRGVIEVTATIVIAVLCALALRVL